MTGFILLFLAVTSIATRHLSQNHHMELPTWQQMKQTEGQFYDKVIGQPYDIFAAMFNNRTLRDTFLNRIEEKFSVSVNDLNEAYKNQGVVGWLKSSIQNVGNVMKLGMIKLVEGIRSVLNSDFHPLDWSMNQIVKGKNFVLNLLGVKLPETAKVSRGSVNKNIVNR